MMEVEVKEKEIEKATRQIVRLSRGLREGAIVASVTPDLKIDVYRSLGEVQMYAGDNWSDAHDRVIFYEDADIDHPEGFPPAAVKEELEEALEEMGYTVR